MALFERLIGMETEYALRIPRPQSPADPIRSHRDAYDAIARSLAAQLPTVPADTGASGKVGLFLGTGGAAWFERSRPQCTTGLLEGATLQAVALEPHACHAIRAQNLHRTLQKGEGTAPVSGAGAVRREAPEQLHVSQAAGVVLVGELGFANSTFGDADFGWFGTLLGSSLLAGPGIGIVLCILIGIALVVAASFYQVKVVDAGWTPGAKRDEILAEEDAAARAAADKETPAKE